MYIHRAMGRRIMMRRPTSEATPRPIFTPVASVSELEGGTAKLFGGSLEAAVLLRRLVEKVVIGRRVGVAALRVVLIAMGEVVAELALLEVQSLSKSCADPTARRVSVAKNHSCSASRSQKKETVAHQQPKKSSEVRSTS